MSDRRAAHAGSSARSSHGLHEELVQVGCIQLAERSVGPNHKQRRSWEETWQAGEVDVKRENQQGKRVFYW